MPTSNDRLIVALDVTSGAQALQLAELLAPITHSFKVGSHLFTLEGPTLIQRLVEKGSRVFLDLKFYDIPEVVAAAVHNAARLRPAMVTLHASGGVEMMRSAVTAIRDFPQADRPLLLGVTVLTSFSTELWRQIFPRDSIEEAVIRLAEAACAAGVDGLVCSPWELKRLAGVKLKKIVPGIRPSASTANDQRRIMTPAEAISAGADYLVVGRPITRALDPSQAARKIREEIEVAMKQF
ncbi:MAG: orotidine-5'-phosphate decarboxylase [Acidobacteria bacterium]|nr:orotidine-5'-phosphate decarboxylase [Acidobacteriota bacterium]